jgi:hypothetical protein
MGRSATCQSALCCSIMVKMLDYVCRPCVQRGIYASIRMSASERPTDRPCRNTRLPLKTFNRGRITAGDSRREDQRVQSSCPRSKGDGRESSSFRTLSAPWRKVR